MCHLLPLLTEALGTSSEADGSLSIFLKPCLWQLMSFPLGTSLFLEAQESETRHVFAVQLCGIDWIRD